MPKSKNEGEKGKGKKRAGIRIKLLVSLIGLILLINIISLIYYFTFKSDLVDISIEYACDDETSYDSCSENKPLYCYNGELVKKAFTCGCPEGYKISFQDCEEI